LKSNKDELYFKLGAIGFRVTSAIRKNNLKEIDIEKTLIESLYHIDTDGRLLGLLLSWLGVHGPHVIADKFFNEYSNAKEYLGESPWFSGICSYMFKLKDHRFKKGIKKLKSPHSFALRDQSTLIKIKGAVDFLLDVNIQVPNSAIRIREQDVFTVEQLVKANHQYRNRCIFGANWRAEIVTTIQKGASNPNQVAKLLGIARSRVGVVFKEYMLVRDFI